MPPINGIGICIGTSYMGRSEVEKDGSYITTQWLSILFPLVPLGSIRVWPQTNRRTFWIPFFYSSNQFEAKQVPFYWPHMFKVYGIYLAIFLFFKFAALLEYLVPNNNVLHPLLSSILAFALSVFVIEITKGLRKIGITVNLFIVMVAVFFSFLTVAGISVDAMISANRLLYFWGAYSVFCIFFRKEKTSNNDDKKQRIARKTPDQVRKSAVPDTIDFK